MSLFANPEEHAANPPSTWRVKKVAERRWALVTKDGAEIDRYMTRKQAVRDLDEGTAFAVDLWEKERRWYAGEPVAGWKPYSETTGSA